MNNEEPVQEVVQNSDVPGEILPEMSVNASLPMVKTLSLTQLIYQWQPMGIRVKVDLPFISEDSSYLFVIRNGPYIPEFVNQGFCRDSSSSPGTDQYVAQWVFLFNNTRPVYHHMADVGWDYNALQGQTGLFPFPTDEKNWKISTHPITITYYDLPPMLSTMAMMFRKWRGNMQYRIRVVAGFATQGYIVTVPIMNAHMPVGVYDEYASTPMLQTNDNSYREGMIHAFVPSDTSMFRHTEVTMPYSYPVPYYDQYHWLDQRITPYNLGQGGEPSKPRRLIVEPHGDNWIGVGVRGALESLKEKEGSVTFELEYRAMEGFQFADPGIPPLNMSTTVRQFVGSSWTRVKQIPNPLFESDGRTIIRDRLKPPVKPEVIEPEETTIPTGIVVPPTGYYPGKLAQLVMGSTQTPIPGHGPNPTAPPVDPIYKQCTYNRAANSTYCLGLDDKWRHWPGDKRTEMKSFVIKNPNHKREITESDFIPPQFRSERGHDFMY